MKNKISLLALCALLFASTSAARADTITINPSDDGVLYTCAECIPVNNGGFIVVIGYIQGIVKFPTDQIQGKVTQAFLAVNPHIPVWDPMDVYGIADDSGMISADDANAGVFIGTWQRPSVLDYGVDVYFDITSFLASTKAPFVGFNFRIPLAGPNLLSSIENNYGHPSQLHVTTSPVPEPATLLLLGSSLFGGGLAARLRRKH